MIHGTFCLMEVTGCESGSKSSRRLRRTKAAQVVYKSSPISSSIFFTAQHPLVGHGLLIFQASRSHSIRQSTVGRTPLDEWSDRRRELYLTKHNTQQTYKAPAGFEPTIPAGERSQTHILDRVARIGTKWYAHTNLEVSKILQTKAFQRL
jgi:hypothetical protein